MKHIRIIKNTILAAALVAVGSSVGLGLFAADSGLEWKKLEANVFNWALKCPDMEPGKAKPRNDPHEVDLTFVGADGSEWKAVKWKKVKP